MMQQQQQLDVFLASYPNSGRVKSDISTVQQRFPNMHAMGDVYVTSAGVSQKLIKFGGTVPIVYKGQTYHIPLTVWLPPSYPFQGWRRQEDFFSLCFFFFFFFFYFLFFFFFFLEAPNIYVTPTFDMAIKPRHQHVDVEGRCFLPALSGWNAQQSNLGAVIGELQGVFAVNPPVFAKPKDTPAVMPPSNPYGTGSMPPPPPYSSPVAAASAAPSKTELLRKQVNEAMLRECRAVSEELTQFMKTQGRLEGGQQEIDLALAKLAEHRRQLQVAIEWTKKSSSDLDEWLAARSAESTQQQLVDVDQIVIPTSAVGGQLLQAVAANKAIEDALYVNEVLLVVVFFFFFEKKKQVLNKALVSDDVEMDCETFAKEHRKLCSAQFMHLALIRKIHQNK